MFNSTHSNSAFCQSQITGLNSPVGDKDGINPSVETVTSTLPIVISSSAFPEFSSSVQLRILFHIHGAFMLF